MSYLRRNWFWLSVITSLIVLDILLWINDANN